jgi:lincosamide nucleotidyltransferase
MNTNNYHHFTRALLESLSSLPEVTGLVALGSMAGIGREPDEWSDHDFFVIVPSGVQDRFRDEAFWIPERERIVLHYRETPHGVKVMFDDGHILEFAVFDLEEIALARVNVFRTLLDRGGVEEKMRQVAERTAGEIAQQADDARYHLHQFLATLVIGAGRFARGERLAGGWMVKTIALQHAVRAIRAALAPANPAALDNLDPLRRLETAYPFVANALADAVALPVAEAARRMLDVVERALREAITPWPEHAVSVVRKKLE